MAIKAVVLAQKNGDGADVALPRTSADLVGYEKENSTATNVREALDEMNDNFQGEAPGIVRRVEVLEAKPAPHARKHRGAGGERNGRQRDPVERFGQNRFFRRSLGRSRQRRVASVHLTFGDCSCATIP